MSFEIDLGKLKQARDERLWSQEDLADASGLSVRTIQRIEKDRLITRDSLKALAAAFDVDAVELVAPATLKGYKAGMLLGTGGAVLGYVFGLAGVYSGVASGDTSYAQAGLFAGLLGAAAGGICAAIAIAGGRYKKRLARQAVL